MLTPYISSQLKADDIDQQFEIRYLLRSAKQYFQSTKLSLLGTAGVFDKSYEEQ